MAPQALELMIALGSPPAAVRRSVLETPCDHAGVPLYCPAC